MQCAYVNAVTIAVDFALNKNRNLFTDGEVQLLASFSTLPYNAQRIYGRLLMRQSKWLKTSDFEKYVDKNMGANLDPVVTTAIEALISQKYLEGVNQHADFDITWDAAVSSFVIPDWQAISTTLLGGRAKATNRDELIQGIRRAIDTQKTFFGASQRDRFAGLVCRHMLVAHNCTLVRLCDEMALLIRRLQRLYQIPSSVTSSSGGLDSAYRKLELCVPLMTTFKLLTFPRYQLPADSPIARDSFLFPDQRTFHCWEAAVELHAMIYELDELEHQVKKEEAHISIFDTLSSRMMRTMQACLQVFENDKFMTLFASEKKSTFEAFIKNIISDFEAEPTRFTTKKVGLVGTICLLSLCAEYNYEVPVEQTDYLIRYRAGTELCRILLATTSTLEKTTEKLYLLAVLLYEFLLCLPYIKHGRGKWYLRLCIDYDHMKLPEMALAAAERGLMDKNILSSDEIGLMDRATVLREKVNKHQQAKLKESTKKQRKSSTTASSASAAAVNEQQCDEYTLTILQSEIWQTMSKPRQMQLLSAMVLQEMERIYRPVLTSQSHRRVFQPSSSLPSSSSATAAAGVSAGKAAVEKWTCQACTYVNSVTKQKLSCGMCMSPRSSSLPPNSSSCSNNNNHVIKKESLSSESRHVINLIDDEDDGHDVGNIFPNVLETKPTRVDLIGTPVGITSTIPNNPQHQHHQPQPHFMSCKYRDMLIAFQREVAGDKSSSQEEQDIIQNAAKCNDDFLHTNEKEEEVIDLSKNDERLAEIVLKKCADILCSLPPPPPPPPLLPQSPPLSQQSVTVTSRNSSPSRRQLRQQFSPFSSSTSDFASGMFTGRAFVVNGRRFHGDINNKRKGKSMFCGVDDDMMSVEDLVMKKLFTVDRDEQQVEETNNHHSSTLSSNKAVPMLRNFRFLSYERIVDDGGWQGYHCEGSIFRTLFGLLIWDIFFLPVPHALLTAHQDAPLDFPTVAFFTARQTQIIERIQQIAHSSNTQLMTELQRVYHVHKGEQCRLVAWDSWDLRALQLAALCIGAEGLAHLCLAMCIDYRQFRSGAPDLFMMRVKVVQGRNGREQIVPLEQLLGENWQSRGTTADDDEAVYGEDLRKPPPSKPDYSQQQQGGSGWGQPRFSFRRQFSGDGSGGKSSSSGGKEQSPQRSMSSPQQRQRSEQQLPQAISDQSMQPLQLLSPPPGSELVYECMWVEVKGPSDHLAYKQLLWLQLLSAANLPAYVGHVKEGQLGGMSRKKAKIATMAGDVAMEL